MGNLFSVIACLFVTYLVLLVLPAAKSMPPVVFYQSNSFDVIAHGNGRALSPGNTLEAAVNALAVGSDILELDIHLTADKQLVVRHDPIIDTTTNGEGKIVDMTVAELQQYDVGFHEIDYPDLQGPPGIVVPTLESLFRTMPNARFIIELKPEDVEATGYLCDLIYKYNLDEQVVVGSFHTSVLQTFRQQCAAIPTSLGQSEAMMLVLLSRIGLGHLYRSEGVSVQLPVSYGGFQIMTKALVESIHRLNMRVDVWTVNDRATMQALIDMGVDGIITDRPDILRGVAG
jgi:glycerophosphoryl diester phosphodiesterase